VLFVCQDGEQRAAFLDAADRQLTGHRWHPDVSPDRYDYVGRRRILFATEIDAHAHVLEARCVPVVPVGRGSRRSGIRRVRMAVATSGGDRAVITDGAESSDGAQKAA